jgi:hypothetical protein
MILETYLSNTWAKFIRVLKKSNGLKTLKKLIFLELCGDRDHERE